MNNFINIASVFTRHIRFAKSCKISTDSIDNTRITLLLDNLDEKSALYLTSLLSNNPLIISFVKDNFIYGNGIFFAFTKKSKRIYIENLDIYYPFQAKSIEWYENDIRFRNYSRIHSNKFEYKLLLNNCLTTMLDFGKCFYRNEDEQYYIGFKTDIDNQLINDLTCIEDLINLCRKYGHENILRQWLCENNKYKPSWLQINEKSITIYLRNI